MPVYSRKLHFIKSGPKLIFFVLLCLHNFLWPGPGRPAEAEEALPHQEQDPGAGGAPQQQDAPGIP